MRIYFEADQKCQDYLSDNDRYLDAKREGLVCEREV